MENPFLLHNSLINFRVDFVFFFLPLPHSNKEPLEQIHDFHEPNVWDVCWGSRSHRRQLCKLAEILLARKHAHFEICSSGGCGCVGCVGYGFGNDLVQTEKHKLFMRDTAYLVQGKLRENWFCTHARSHKHMCVCCWHWRVFCFLFFSVGVDGWRAVTSILWTRSGV